FANFFIRGL
nr:Chain C, PHE-ALA-ASN-PHE-PHE-ILE-ARG-GLY-LEU [synthetic construct]6LUP_F Chain F, PHE-ALA-ASN-PHE-PHE-ILE-ARG-GLY-LEU [synthetic construct]